MRPYTLYKVGYYDAMVEDLNRQIKEAKLAKDEPLRKQLVHKKKYIQHRAISSRRDLRVKMDIIEHGDIGPMPEVFPDGKTTKLCPKCFKRCDTVDMLQVWQTGWRWTDTCQKCIFEEKSAIIIEVDEKDHAETAKLNPKNVTEKICLMCGEIRPITNFERRGLMRFEDDGVLRDYMCKRCRRKFDSMKLKLPRGVRPSMPFLYNPQNPTEYILNAAYFHEREDLLNPEIITLVRDAIKDINEKMFLKKDEKDTKPEPDNT